MTSAEAAFRHARRRGRGTWWHIRLPTAIDLAGVLQTFGSRGPTGHVDHLDIDLNRIVGTTARPDDFDQHLQPRTGHLRDRWISVYDARRHGTDLGCISLIRIGDLYLIDDGHHRASVARALGQPAIPACVRRICTNHHACLDCMPTAGQVG